MLFSYLLLLLYERVTGQIAISNPVHYDIAQFWPGGFQAKITIVIKRDIKFGWMVKMTFTSPVTSIEIFDGQVAEISADQQVYVIKHQNYNAGLQTHQGQVVVFFTGTQPDGVSGPPNCDLLFVEFTNTFETVEEALTRVGTTLERDGTGNTLETTPSSRINPVFDPRGNTPLPPPIEYYETTTTEAPFVHDLKHVLNLSLLFFEAQRSGKLTLGNRIKWRQNTGLLDGSFHKVDLVGGYYVDHGYIKYGYPMASAMTILAWGVERYKRAYMIADEYRNAMAAVKWGAEYFIKCHTQEYEFYGQVGESTQLNEYWGRAEDLPEVYDTRSFKCTVKKPCSDLLAETAAALAAANVIFRGFDDDFAKKCLRHAIGLYKFANQYRGSYHESIKDAAGRYKSHNGFHDELAWAALWLRKATKQKFWVDKAASHIKFFNRKTKMEYFNWDDKRAGVRTLLASITNQTDHWSSVRRFCDYLLPGGGAEYTPRGLLFLTQWGTLGATSNSVFLCLIAAEYDQRPNVYRLLAKKQLFYILGENTERSFMVGYGINSPQRPYHKASSCPSKPDTCDWDAKNSEDPNPHTLFGAIVSGPNQIDEYKDDRSDYQHSAVSLTQNAGFTGLAAGIYELELDGITVEDKTAQAVRGTQLGNQLFEIGTFAPNWGELIHSSLLFYEAQRSGKKALDGRIKWRGDSAMSDVGNGGEDLSGGYFDAGDFMKFNFPMAYSMTTLAWGGIQYRDAYESANELDNLKDALRWGCDYLMACHPEKFKLYGQVGLGKVDHARWGRPEDITWKRPAYFISDEKAGSDLAGQTAAALAASSILLREDDPKYAALLLKHARELYELADRYRDYYHRSIEDAANYYKSSGFGDEIVWAAAWIYYATSDKWYLNAAERTYNEFALQQSDPYSYFWDDVTVGVHILLANMTKPNDRQKYEQPVMKFCDQYMRGEKARYTPKGLLFINEWGPNRYAANTAFICGLAADQGINQCQYREFAKNQIEYLVGKEVRSYVVGYGRNPPARPHHRGSSCPPQPRQCGTKEKSLPGPNPFIITGALVGGPDITDRYYDDRANYKQSEVALDYNAGFQGALAAQLALKLNPPAECIVTTTTSTTTTTTVSTSSVEVVDAEDVNINDAMYGDLVFDEQFGWIRKPSAAKHPTSNAGQNANAVNDILRDYMPDIYNDDSSLAHIPEYDFDYDDYLYNPFPVLYNNLVETGDIDAPKTPDLNPNRGTYNSNPRGLITPRAENINGIDDILALVDQLDAGKSAEDFFTTKPTRSTKYIPPIPTSPRTLSPRSLTTRAPITYRRTLYSPPIKNYITEPPTTLPPLTTIMETTENVTTTISSTTPVSTKKSKSESTRKPKKRKRPSLNLKPGIPTSKKTGLNSKIMDSNNDLLIEPNANSIYTEEPKIECTDIDAMKERVLRK